MINKDKVKKQFSRHAHEYDRYALLQQEAGQELLQRLAIEPQSILDLGCGTGAVLLELAKRFPFAEIYALDISEAMVQEAQRKALRQGFKNISFSVQDMEFPVYPEESFDLIISNLSLQWADHLPETFSKLRRLLRPGGCLLFSILGKGSLAELRRSARHAFGRKYVYEQTFSGIKEIERELKRSGFEEIKLEQSFKERTYDSPADLMKVLKHIGAQNASGLRPQRLVPKNELNALFEYYGKNFKIGARIRATYELIYGQGFAALK